mmetsp:Transcript_7187/g.13661  ORF Transcript_7187/g.13661 Transcript_7187/m.13661 type:complete len:556 (+) Transcript_7187:77-1744(+)
MPKNVTPTSSSSIWSERNFSSDNITLDTIGSLNKESFDYSTSSSKEDDLEGTILSSNTKTSNSTITTQNNHIKYDLELIKRERDCARDEATQTQDKLNAIMEAIHILTRQLKKTSTSTSSSSSTTETTTPHEILEAPSYASADNSTSPQEQTHDPMVRNRLSSDGSGATTGSIAAYVTKDMLRFSEIVRQCSSSSTIGSSLIALDAACRSLEQNAKWTCEESSMVLQDLQQTQAELNEVDFRCHRAEKCAKQLYKQNLVLKKELEKSKAEKRVLVREIRALMEEKEDREAFQKRLVENMKAHEEIMIEQTGPSSKTRNGGVRDMEGTGGDEALKEPENIENDGTQQQHIDDTVTKDSSTPYSMLNHFGKIFQSLNGSSGKNDYTEKTSVLADTTSQAAAGARDNAPSTPTTNDSALLYSTQLSFIEESPTLSTIWDASPSIGSEYSYDNPVLQLTPTLSSCDSMKSVLSASDLNSNDDNDEFNQSVVGESKARISQRKKASSVASSSSSWIKQVNAPKSNTQKTVITVKLPRKSIPRRHPRAGIINNSTTNHSLK